MPNAADFKKIIEEKTSKFLPNIKAPYAPTSTRHFTFNTLANKNTLGTQDNNLVSLVIVETRASETNALRLTITSMRKKINAPITLICGIKNANEACLAMQKSGFVNYKVLRLEQQLDCADDYNRLLMSFNFWNQMYETEKLLVFQTDSVICEKSNFSLEDFKNFDYIGGQWMIERPCGLSIYGGSGGFSLRDRKLSIQALKLFGNSSWQFGEDGFYGFFIDVLGGKVGTQQDMDNFCSEKQWKEGCFAIHKLKIIPNDREQVASIAEHCPTWLRMKGVIFSQDQ